MGKFSKDWMDLWDLGILIANRAYQAGRPGNHPRSTVDIELVIGEIFHRFIVMISEIHVWNCMETL